MTNTKQTATRRISRSVSLGRQSATAQEKVEGQALHLFFFAVSVPSVRPPVEGGAPRGLGNQNELTPDPPSEGARGLVLTEIGDVVD
jgi:hypothetical protein